VRHDLHVLDSDAPDESASLYETYLGRLRVADGDRWIRLRSPHDDAGAVVPARPRHVPPRWPAVPGDQRMTVHLGLAVDDLGSASGWARRGRRSSPKTTFG
jgi:hypothetical protein